MRSIGTRAAALGVVLVLAACTGQAPEEPASPESSPQSAPPSSPTPAAGAQGDRPDSPKARRGSQRPTGWGPTLGEMAQARKHVSELSTDELAGQLVVATYDGTSAPVDLVRGQHLGGVIAMEPNIESVEQIRKVNRKLQRRSGRDYPLWIGVDQEGGVVNRLDDTMTPFPTYLTYGAARDPALARSSAAGSGAELRAAGFTAVYAPVADVTVGPEDPVIGSRAASSSPSVVARTVVASVEGYRRAGIAPVVKHFPGHGSLTVDSHERLPTQRRPLAMVRKRDYLPFREAVDAGAPAVMLGHIDVPALDAGVPASLSSKVITGELRDRLGFKGVVMTDAMNMGAIVNEYGASEAAVMTVKAGADQVLMPADTTAAVGALAAAIESGEIDEEQARSSATRTIALLLHGQSRKTAAQPGSSTAATRAASAAAVTVTDGPCRGRLVRGAVDPLGSSEAVRAFTAAARREGLRIGAGAKVRFIGWGDAPGSADVAVTTDTPYALGRSAAPVRIALYGETPQSMRALVRVLLGEARAPGKLPVPVRGVARRGC